MEHLFFSIHVSNCDLNFVLMISGTGSDSFNSSFSKSLKLGSFPEGFLTKKNPVLFN